MRNDFDEFSNALQEQSARRQKRMDVGKRVFELATSSVPFSNEVEKLFELIGAHNSVTSHLINSGVDPERENEFLKRLCDIRREIQDFISVKE